MKCIALSDLHGDLPEDEVCGTKIVNVSIKDENYKINYIHYAFEI